MTVNVSLSGKLVLDGYGQGHPTNELSMGVPFDEVALIKINGRQGQMGADVKADDRVALIAADVAAFWRYVGLQNLGMNGVVDF